jgi:restriction system protein
LHKEKIKINITRWLFTILNLAIIIIIYRYIQLGLIAVNKDRLHVTIFIIYGLLSTFLIKVHSNRKLKNMYLNCNINDVDEMTGIEFEYFLYYKFKRMRYRVKTTPISGDYGADLVLKKRREKIVVQAKRYQSVVGIAAVQEVIGSIAYYNADRGMVITNSYFTPNAINLARANDITLWDRKALIKQLIKEEDYELLDDVPASDENTSYCPLCGKKLIYRSGRYGYFLGCSGFPKCSYTESTTK